MARPSTWMTDEHRQPGESNSGASTSPVQIRTLNDIDDSAVAMDEGLAMRYSDGSLQQGAGRRQQCREQ